MRFRIKKGIHSYDQQSAAVQSLVRSCELLAEALAKQTSPSLKEEPRTRDSDPTELDRIQEEDGSDGTAQQQPTLDPSRTAFIGRGSDLLTGLTLLGLACYAVTWFGYFRFYGDLGIKPAEIGITYAYIVSRAAVGLIVLVIAAIALLLPLFLSTNFRPPHSSSWSAAVLTSATPILLGVWTFKTTNGFLSNAIGWALIWFGATLSLATSRAIADIIGWKLENNDRLAYPLLIVSVVMAVLLSWRVASHAASISIVVMLLILDAVFIVLTFIAINALASRSSNSSIQQAGISEPSGHVATPSQLAKTLSRMDTWFGSQFNELTTMEAWVRWTIMAFVVTLLLFVFIWASAASGARAAERITRGQPAFGKRSMAKNILDLEAPKMEVIWIGQSTGKALPKKAVYIGNSGGVVTLFSPSTCQPIRTPAGSVILKQISDESDIGSCPDG